MTEMEQLRQDLTALGVEQGDSLLVHSSMKALGTDLSPEQVIACLQDALGPEGTLLMPALDPPRAPQNLPGGRPGAHLSRLRPVWLGPGVPADRGYFGGAGHPAGRSFSFVSHIRGCNFTIFMLQ